MPLTFSFAEGFSRHNLVQTLEEFDILNKHYYFLIFNFLHLQWRNGQCLPAQLHSVCLVKKIVLKLSKYILSTQLI